MAKDKAKKLPRGVNLQTGERTDIDTSYQSRNLWINSDRSRQYVGVWNGIAEGKTVQVACESVGIPYRRYVTACGRHPDLARKHREAMDARATMIEDALFSCAVGGTSDVIEQYDADGQLVGRQVRRYAPDPKAAHKWLASRKPEQFSEKTETVHSGEIAQRVIMPAVTVGGDAITFDVGSAVDAVVTNG